MVQQYWNNAEATIYAYKDVHALTIAIGAHIGIENTYDKQIHLLDIELHHNHEFLREFFCCCKYVTIAFWRCPACKQMNEVEWTNRQNAAKQTHVRILRVDWQNIRINKSSIATIYKQHKTPSSSLSSSPTSLSSASPAHARSSSASPRGTSLSRHPSPTSQSRRLPSPTSLSRR